MSPKPTAPNAAASASPKEQLAPQAIARKYISADGPLSGAYNMPASAQPLTKQFDDIFHAKFMKIIAEWNSTSNRSELTQLDRKEIIQSSYEETDEIYFGRRQLSERERKLRALTKLFYKVLSEEPWAESWIRAPDVERKLSRFELHKDSLETAFRLGVPTPREAVKAAREALVKQQEQIRALGDKSLKEARIDRGPWDDIEIIYVPGTVSAAATSRLNRDATYPIAVSSVANTLYNHICREMVRPYAMAEEFLDCTDTDQLIKLHDFATDVCNYCPHLLDNDNVSLLVVLLIISRSDVCKLWDERGIRIEGSTISHRKAECMKNKLGWGTTDLRKPFDSFANEFQTRVKNAVNPDARAQRGGLKKGWHSSSTPTTPLTPGQHHPTYATIPSPTNHRLMRVPVQMTEPARLAEQSKGKAPLACMEVVRDPRFQAPNKLNPSAIPFQPSDKFELPTSSTTIRASDNRAVYEAQIKQRLMDSQLARGRTPSAPDSVYHVYNPTQPWRFPKLAPSPQSFPPPPGHPQSPFPQPPNASTQQAPKRRLEAQDTLTDPLPPQKVPKLAPPPRSFPPPPEFPQTPFPQPRSVGAQPAGANPEDWLIAYLHARGEMDWFRRRFC
jgi:hypothetical protein